MTTKSLFNQRLYKILANRKALSQLTANQKATVILVCGPTGSGKTHDVRHALDDQAIPYWVADMTQFSEVGYQGADMVTMFQAFWQYTDYDRSIMASGCLVLDEFDKIQASHDTSSKDVNGRGLQQGLLKFLDGMILPLNTQEQMRSLADTKIDTGAMSYILVGAFEELGLSSDLSDPALRQALKSSGFIPELIDRIDFILFKDRPDEVELLDAALSRTDGLVAKANRLLARQGVQARLPDAPAFWQQVLVEHQDALGSYRGLEVLVKGQLLSLLLD